MEVSFMSKLGVKKSEELRHRIKKKLLSWKANQFVAHKSTGCLNTIESVRGLARGMSGCACQF